MDAKHTPKPWKVWRKRKLEGTTSYTIVGDESGWPVAFVPGPVDTPDAVLIASAPDLLAACQMIDDFHTLNVNEFKMKYSDEYGYGFIAKTARAAIAKATGEAGQ